MCLPFIYFFSGRGAGSLELCGETERKDLCAGPGEIASAGIADRCGDEQGTGDKGSREQVSRTDVYALATEKDHSGES